jgi:site-specific DNA recombinase
MALHAICVDKLDGRIDGSAPGCPSNGGSSRRHEAADRSYLEEGAKLIELAHGAQRLFAKQEAREQRRLLNFVLSNSIWKEGELTATFRQPFDLIAEVAAAVSDERGGRGLNSPGHPAWLGD